jgi:hypothetical protein
LAATAETLDHIAEMVADWRAGRRPASQVLISIETVVREAGVRRQAESRSYAEPGGIYDKPLG